MNDNRQQAQKDESQTATPISNLPKKDNAQAISNLTKSKFTKETAEESKVRAEALKKMEKESEEEAASQLAQKYNLPYFDLNIIPLDNEIIGILPEAISRSASMAVVGKQKDKLKVAITDPLNQKAKAEIDRLREKGFDVEVIVISVSGLKRAQDRYQFIITKKPVSAEEVKLSPAEIKEFEESIQHLKDLAEKIANLPVSEVFKIVIAGAIKMKASDIHLEPEKEYIRLRYRLDGVLHDITHFSKEYYHFINSRIKMLSGLKLNITNQAQDGRFSIKLDEGEIDIRVSVIPGNYGESFVMRLLGTGATQLNLEDLGLEGRAHERIKSEISRPHGMILTTGPTGSGKTTTLYAFINSVNEEGTKIITLEDPIEYKLEGISQTQVNREANYTFAKGLRAILRQDPDVIMVGEIRDLETAEIAVNAALTGHLVFSTLHTNSAAGAIPRLLDLGIEPHLIKPSLNAIIAQRLVRKLCSACREEYTPAAETIENIKKILSVISPKAKVEVPKNIKTLFRAKGCPLCNNTGYKGRIGLFEVFTINDDIEKLILEQGSTSEILAAAIEDGMITMLQDGILKSVHGTTSMEEVYRVTGQGEFVADIYEKVISETLTRGITVNQKDVEQIKATATNFAKVQKLLEKSATKDILKNIIGAAFLFNAADIHIEPEAKDIKIRFRIDGILQEVASLPPENLPTLSSELKILAGFKADSFEVVQDGRFSIKYVEEDQDARLSLIKGGYGETAVIRLLKAKAIALSLPELGFRTSDLKKIDNQLSKPNGLVLATGPTGSGKTTTLYSFLSKLNNPDVKIITVEDPIEYRLEGVLQTQVDEEKGYSFATALRALLRQNPNIIMIGEIRDDKTAEIATQAALTGHLVFSTLHTNSAAAAFQRAINLGVNPPDIASATNCVVAQRLVRKLCDCKEAYTPNQETIDKINKSLNQISPKTNILKPKITKLYRPVGCKKCNKLGYKGTIGIYEVLVVDKEIEEKISFSASSREIEETAIKNGMTTLAHDAYLKALEGITSLEEVLRVTQE
jgi:type IV pilus assembly protein PilB